MPYSVVDDMLIGDITVGTGSRQDKYVTDASEEIDACLGYRYELPLVEVDIAPYAWLYLKRCANLIASGRWIMAMAVAGEDTSQHAYGLSLVQEGQTILQGLCGGAIDLPGAVPVDPVSTGRDVGPGIANQDASSPLDAFYSYTMGTETAITWQPGVMPL